MEQRKNDDHWVHAYVEWHVRLFERNDHLREKMVQVPKWYAKLWRYPDSTWKRAGKNLAYHIGHITAVGSFIAPVVIVAAVVL